VAGPWPLIGRERELEVVANALATLSDTRATGARAAGVLLAGPAGVGKTRLAGDFLAAAAGRGYPSARVFANRSARELPLGAFAPLLPPWQELPEPTELLPQAVAAVTERAEDQPLVLMVDDAHDLDPTSAALLLQVVVSGRVFVIVTVRTGEPVPDPVTRLWKDELVVRVELGPLDASEVARVLTRALEGPVDGGTVQALWNASGGNPLYLRELVTAAREEGALRELSGIWHLAGALPTSARLSELVGTRLAGLEEPAREAVEMVSLAEPLPLGVLEQTVGLGAVEGLEARGLLDVDGEPPAARLAHPVYGEVVRAEMPSGRRRRLSRVLADQSEADRVPRPDDLVRIALWRIEAGDQPAPDLLVDAARQAHAASDWVLTARLARVARDAGGGAQAGHLLGKSLDTLGEHAEAEAVLAEAEAAAVGEGERVLVVAARADNLYRGLGRADEADRLLRATEATVRDPELIDGLRAQRAILDVLAGRVLDALATARPLLQPGDDRAYVQGGLAVATALAINGQTAEAVTVADRAVAARLAFADGVQLAHPGVFFVARALALAQAGRLAEAEGTATAGYDGSARAQVADGQAWFSMILGHTHLLQGRLLDAIDRFREGAALFESIGHPASRWCRAGIVLAAAQRADHATPTRPRSSWRRRHHRPCSSWTPSWRGPRRGGPSTPAPPLGPSSSSWRRRPGAVRSTSSCSRPSSRTTWPGWARPKSSSTASKSSRPASTASSYRHGSTTYGRSSPATDLPSRPPPTASRRWARCSAPPRPAGRPRPPPAGKGWRGGRRRPPNGLTGSWRPARAPAPRRSASARSRRR
jgi:tetratricopeptide (TPR) repeat protein